MARKKHYDHLQHERDKHNDERMHSKDGEKSGPYKYDRQQAPEYYAGSKAKRKQEAADAGMIHEDHSAIANLPQDVQIRPYGNRYGYTPEDLDDTIGGIDRQISYDDGKKMEHFYPKKV